MAFLISDLKNDVVSMMHGTTEAKIQGFDNLIDRAARDVLTEVDPAETKRIEQITNAIHTRVFDYSAPSDLKGNKIIDIRPQVNRNLGDNFSQLYSEQFDLQKRTTVFDLFQVEFDTGTKFLRIKKDVGSGKTIHDLNSISGNGTWAVGNDATNLTEDRLQFISGSTSLNFDMDGSTTDGFIENSTFTAIDLSADEDLSSIFLFVFFPDSSAITSVDLRWGSDTTNFWNRTVTAPHFGAFQNGWNLFRFDWNGATKTLSPDASAINLLRVTINYDGVADTDFRVDNIVSRLGTIFEIVYYSKFIFSSSAGVFIERVAADTDIINLDTDSFNLLVYKAAQLAAQQIQGEDASFDVNFFNSEWDRVISKYKQMYKSEVEKPTQSYYKMEPKKYGRRRFIQHSTG